ncbi:MAG: tetratricopeptide repeat protein, partial [Gemmatimonadaceae bacterium]|nr:tetratricopeptide repeat protein [Gemmatimonadaceae bacterium]
MKARLGYARSMVAAAALILGAAPVASAQATRTPNPNAPRLVVGTLRSSDKKLSVQATEEFRSRLNADIPFRMLTVISSADYKTVVEQSGYPYDEALSTGDLGSLAKLLRTDEFIEGTVEKTATGFIINATLTLTRDAGLTQPLPPAEGDRLARVASALSKSLQDARKQIDQEKKCNMQGRDNKPAEAIAAARAGVAAYPSATLVRLCELNVRVGFKQPPDSIIAISLEILKYDPKSKVALANAAQAYKDKGDDQSSTDMLVRLLATDPTNTRMVEDVVNSLAATGKWELAKPVISQAIKDNPGDVRLMLLGFLVYLNSGDNKNGTALGEEMVKIDTSLADTAYFAKMVGAYEADSNSAKATELAARGVEKFPANATLLGMLGQKQLNSGQQQQAIATFRKILSINPKAPGIRALIARTYVEMKQLDSALAMLRDGKSAGEEGQGIGAYAVTVANSVLLPSAKAELAKALASKTPEDFATAIEANLRIYPWVTFADSTATVVETKNTAKLIYAVAAYQLSAAALTEASNAKSCPRAKLAQEN